MSNSGLVWSLVELREKTCNAPNLYPKSFSEISHIWA